MAALDTGDLKEREALKENQELLVKCISQDLGYVEGKPVAAYIIYKYLLQWRSFESEGTNIFDRILQTISSAIEVQDNNEVLAYWLSNSAILLVLLERTLEAPGEKYHHQSGGVSFLTRKLDDSRQGEVKYPGQLFKNQLTKFLENIYGMIIDKLKKEIYPLLELCIKAPRTSRASLVKGRAQADVVAQEALIAHWKSIRKSLNIYLNLMKTNNVPPFLVRKVFTQIFSFINIHLINSILLRRECCSFRNGGYIEAGLSELKQWCIEATDKFAGSAWDELRRIQQAAGFLVIRQKQNKTVEEITRELCPALSIQQLYRISTMYCDDKYDTHSVSPDVIAKMRIMLTEESNNALSSEFLLEDDSSIAFTVEDISKSMEQVDLNDIQTLQLIGLFLSREEDKTNIKWQRRV